MERYIIESFAYYLVRVDARLYKVLVGESIISFTHSHLNRSTSHPFQPSSLFVPVH